MSVVDENMDPIAETPSIVEVVFLCCIVDYVRSFNLPFNSNEIVFLIC